MHELQRTQTRVLPWVLPWGFADAQGCRWHGRLARLSCRRSTPWLGGVTFVDRRRSIRQQPRRVALRATSESVSDPGLVRAAASHRGTAAAAPANWSGEPGRLRRLPALRATSESVSDPDLVRAAASHRGTAAAAPVNGSVEKGRLRSLPSLLALWVRRNVGDLLCLSRQRFSWRVAKTRQPSRLHEGTDEEICIVPSLTVDRSRHSRGRASPLNTPSRKVGRVG